MVQELGSYVEGSIDLTTQTSTPKFVEEVATEVMKIDKAPKLFQTMATVSLNMGNLTLEVNTLKTKLAIKEKEKVVLQDKLDKERDFQKGYKHNVEIWRKYRVEVEQKIKVLIKKLQDANEELKGSTTGLKSQDEELKDLTQKITIQETIERKWTEALFLHKKQHEVLDSQVKALTKENKEKENVLTYLELINQKNVFLLQSKELRKKTTKAERKKLMKDKEYQRNLQHS